MKFVIQRVNSASVTVEGKVAGSIGKGFMVLIGVCNEDTEATADRLVKKMLGLRIFEDSEGKTNLSLESVAGDLLLVSQFTLYADCRKGNRPSFVNAGSPEHAEKLYNYIVKSCQKLIQEMNNHRYLEHISNAKCAGVNLPVEEARHGVDKQPEENTEDMGKSNIIAHDETKIQKVETGIFGADMTVSLENAGPFTIILDSNDLN